MVQLRTLLLLALCVPLHAATYYIDYVGGSDSNAGTSTGAPWQHHPWDSRATGSAATTLSAGDVTILKGGVTYTLTSAANDIDAAQNGTSGAHIVIDGDSGDFASRWGSGTNRAIIDGNAAATKLIDLTSAQYIDLRHLDFYNGGYGCVNITFTSATSCTVSNSLIREVYDWDLESGPNKDIAFVQGIGSAAVINGTASGIIVDGCEITKTGGAGVVINGTTSNVTVRNCDIHDYINWFIDVSTYYTNDGHTNLFIHNNLFRNMYHYSASYWSGAITDAKLNYSTNENPHQDGIFIRQPAGSGLLKNMQVYNNQFYNDITKTEYGGTAWIYCSQINSGSEVLFYNNILNDPYPYFHIMTFSSETGYTLRFYHNTFVGVGTPIRMLEQTAGTSHVFDFRNNIFSAGASYFPDPSTGSSCANIYTVMSSDRNLFNSTGWVCDSGCYYDCDLTEWQTASSEDANSTYGLPYFTDLQTGSGAPSADLTLTASSDAIGASLVLDTATYPGADYDIAGNYRGTTGATTEAGAYVYSEASPPETPATTGPGAITVQTLTIGM